ncbi:MAG: hypothetical protein ACOC3V_04115 [bacterium]
MKKLKMGLRFKKKLYELLFDEHYEVVKAKKTINEHIDKLEALKTTKIKIKTALKKIDNFLENNEQNEQLTENIKKQRERLIRTEESVTVAMTKLDESIENGKNMISGMEAQISLMDDMKNLNINIFKSDLEIVDIGDEINDIFRHIDAIHETEEELVNIKNI